MALRSRFDEPPVVLLVAALLVAAPAVVLQAGGAIGAALAAGVALFGDGLLAWRLRLASPAAVAVGVAGLVGASSADSTRLVVAGPVLVVGLAVALLAQFRLATPLLFAGLEVGSVLAGPGSGDSVGSLVSLLWIFGVPPLASVAAAELWLRTEAVPAPRRRTDAP